MTYRAVQFIAILLALSCDHAPSSAASSSAAGSAPAMQNTGPQASKPESKLVFNTMGNDLGTIEWPGSAETFFTFKNVGATPIVIRDMFASCGCTNPRLRIVKNGKVVREGYGRGEVLGPLLLVASGEEGELRARFETRGLSGEAKDHISTITIVTDEPRVDPIQRFIRAQIDRKWELSPAMIAFDPMGGKQTQTKEAKLYILSAGAAAPFEGRVVSAPPGVQAALRDALQGVRPYVQIEVLAGPGLPQQQIQGEIVIEGKFAKPASQELHKVTIPFIIPVVGDVQVKPRLFDFQVVEAEKPARSAPVTLDLLDPDRKLQLGAPVIDGESADRLRVEAAAVKEGQQYTLTLVADKGLPLTSANGIHGMVRIPTGLPDFPELRLEYRALTRVVPHNK